MTLPNVSLNRQRGDSLGTRIEGEGESRNIEYVYIYKILGRTFLWCWRPKKTQLGHNLDTLGHHGNPNVHNPNTLQ